MHPSLNSVPPSCPACEGNDLTDLGELPHRKGLVTLPEAGHLYRCNNCWLSFRHPYAPDDALAATYLEMPAGTWANSQLRKDFALAARLLLRFSKSGHILDVGCSQGDFLVDYLPSSFHKAGVEPSAAAQQRARTRGVTVISGTIADIPPDTPAFDAISMIDCIEHLREPFQALTLLSRHLRPGGLLLISTGNSAFPLWMLLGTDYYYYYNEHVSFLNRRWFEWAARRLGLEVFQVRHFAHNSLTLRAQVKQVIACSLRLLQRAISRCKPLSVAATFYPFSLCARISGFGIPALPDHFMVLLIKGGSSENACR